MPRPSSQCLRSACNGGRTNTARGDQFSGSRGRPFTALEQATRPHRAGSERVPWSRHPCPSRPRRFLRGGDRRWWSGAFGGSDPTRPEALELFAESLDARDWVALEVTGNAWEIARIIEPHVARVIVVSPSDTGIRQARAKTDRLDARALAKLLWAGRARRRVDAG